MPDCDEKDKSSHPLDDEAFRLQMERLKARVASLHQRVDALERKKREDADDSTQGRN